MGMAAKSKKDVLKYVTLCCTYSNTIVKIKIHVVSSFLDCNVIELLIYRCFHGCVSCIISTNEMSIF